MLSTKAQADLMLKDDTEELLSKRCHIWGEKCDDDCASFQKGIITPTANNEGVTYTKPMCTSPMITGEIWVNNMGE